jgi:CubicO group peptidase (beta-lactamase class C family)
MKRLSILLLVGALLVVSMPTVGLAQETLDIVAIDAYIENLMAENQIPGLALSIVHNDEIVYTQGYGVAGLDGTQVTPQTPFIIGSTSKSFTALAVMQLVEAGKIDLDAPVQAYLPWFSLADPEQAQQMTVRHLLTHTSGFSYLQGDKDILNDDTSDEALEANIRELADYNLARPVGESFDYSNINYDTLGLIIQTVSGQSFEEYIKEHIYTPLEMSNSYTSRAEAEANGLVMGHTYFFGSPRVSDDVPYPRRKLPSGFLISSAEDLGQFLIAQLNGGNYGGKQILAPEYVTMMHQPAVETGFEDWNYAFGWRTKDVGGEPSVRHGGDSSNFHSDLAFSPTRGWGVAIVTNYTGAPISNVVAEPQNEVLRMVSGYDTGYAAADVTGTLMVVWGIVIILVIFNGALWGVFYWRRWQRDRQLRLVWHLILPLVLDIILMWLILFFVPNLFESTVPIMFVFVPDLTLILLACVVVVAITAVAQVVVYIAFARRPVLVPVANIQQ